MNKQINTYINLLKDRLDRLESLLTKSREERETLQTERKDLIKEKWAKVKESSILRSSQEDFEALQQENKRLKESQDEIEIRLIRVLKKTRALSEAFHR
jgi:hypothetical protein